MAIQRARNVSRSSRCQPYAKSATERNFKAKASSRKPNVTFTTLSQPPLLGALLSHVGKRAKRVNGNANARAKPNMPTVGARAEPPLVLTSTSRKPMMGPVHEKLTNESVKAMRKMLRRPVVRSALLSTAEPHDEGSVISKPPKKLAAKTRSIRKKRMLNTALVLKSLRALAPKMEVMMRPSAT